jgi:flagellar assembly protein FliH
MAPKIIKQGSARAAIVRQFQFSENSAEEQRSMEPMTWPEFPAKHETVSQKSPEKADSAEPDIDLAELEKRAFQNGYSHGEKSGMEAAERKIDAAMKRLGEAILEIGKLRPFLHAQVEREVVKLAVEVAKKIVHREIQADPQIIQTLIRVALDHVAEKSAVIIHLNPVDHNYLMEQRLELSQSEGRDISLLADKSIERGGCLIQTECGDVDARIEEKFKEVENTFFEGMK